MRGAPRLLSPGVRWTPNEAAAQGIPPLPEVKPDRRRKAGGRVREHQPEAAPEALRPAPRAGCRARVHKPEAEAPGKKSWKVAAVPGPAPGTAAGGCR